LPQGVQTRAVGTELETQGKANAARAKKLLRGAMKSRLSVEKRMQFFQRQTQTMARKMPNPERMEDQRNVRKTNTSLITKHPERTQSKTTANAEAQDSSARRATKPSNPQSRLAGAKQQQCRKGGKEAGKTSRGGLKSLYQNADPLLTLLTIFGPISLILTFRNGFLLGLVVMDAYKFLGIFFLITPNRFLKRIVLIIGHENFWYVFSRIHFTNTCF